MEDNDYFPLTNGRVGMVVSREIRTSHPCPQYTMEQEKNPNRISAAIYSTGEVQNLDGEGKPLKNLSNY